MSEEVTARKRGRPRKNPLPDAVSAPSEPQIKRAASTKASTANKTTKAASSSSKPSKTTKPKTTSTSSKSTPAVTASKSKSVAKETSTSVKSSLKPASTTRTTPAAPQSSRILKEVEAARAVSANEPQPTASKSVQQPVAPESSPTLQTPKAATGQAALNTQPTFEAPKSIPSHVPKSFRPAAPPLQPPFAAGKQHSPIDADAVRRTGQYKTASRRVTAAMVAMPIALVTSWVLFDRLALGNERRIPFLAMTEAVNEGTARRVQDTLELDSPSRKTGDT